MKVDLLESVRRTILHNPDRFCAAQWAFARNAAAVLRHGAAPDGFRCCIAGHVLLQSNRCSEEELLRRGGFHTGGPLWDRAAEALQVGERTSQRLFFPSQWPSPFKQEYYLCARDEEASVAADYLARVIGEQRARRDPETDAAARNAATVGKSREGQVRDDSALDSLSTPRAVAASA